MSDKTRGPETPNAMVDENNQWFYPDNEEDANYIAREYGAVPVLPSQFPFNLETSNFEGIVPKNTGQKKQGERTVMDNSATWRGWKIVYSPSIVAGSWLFTKSHESNELEIRCSADIYDLLMGRGTLPADLLDDEKEMREAMGLDKFNPSQESTEPAGENTRSVNLLQAYVCQIKPGDALLINIPDEKGVLTQEEVNHIRDTVIGAVGDDVKIVFIFGMKMDLYRKVE